MDAIDIAQTKLISITVDSLSMQYIALLFAVGHYEQVSISQAYFVKHMHDVIRLLCISLTPKIPNQE